MTTAKTAGRHARQHITSMDSPSWAKAAIAVGWAGKALVYAIIAALAFQVATSGSGQADQQGALTAIAATGWGTALLTLLGIALLVHAAENAGEAAKLFGPSSVRNSTAQRAGRAASAVAHALLAFSAFSILSKSKSSAGGGDPTQVTATVFSWPGGRLLIGLAALLLIAVGVYYIVKDGIQRGYTKTLAIDDAPSGTRRWIDKVSVVGLIARGVAFVGVGVFLGIAALRYDPQQAKGLDELLKSLAQAAYGPALLIAAALGLLAYAFYCLVQAKWRQAS